MAKRLDTVVNIAILFTCALVAATLLPRFWKPSPAVAADARADMIRPGDRISAPDLRNTPRTMVLVWRADCRYCAEGAPFYRKLSQVIAERHAQLSLLVITTDPKPASADVLNKLEIVVSNILSVSPEQQRHDYKVMGTPTLIALDSNGVVERVWFGKLNENGEREVLDFVSASKRPT